MKISVSRPLSSLIASKFFCQGDTVTMSVAIEFIAPKNEKSLRPAIETNVLPIIERMLSAGEVPHINPSFISKSPEKETELCRKSLVEYLDNDDYYYFEELDVNSDFATCNVDISVFFLNFMNISKDDLAYITSINVKGGLGEYEIVNIEKN